MGIVTFRFVKPDSWVGRLICWRLKEPWSHVAILFNDHAYSAQIPRVVCLPLTHKDVALPPRSGKDVLMTVTEVEEARMRRWCESQLGKTYDYVSILGWALGWNWLQSRRNSYCFEFVHQCLEYMGWLKPSYRLIKGNRLILDIDHLIETFVTKTPSVIPTTENVVSVDYEDHKVQDVKILDAS